MSPPHPTDITDIVYIKLPLY